MPIFNRITYGPVEKPEAYAVFDSSDGSMTFFRDDKGKYTDGQVSGTKTYYTGFEDNQEAAPSWVDFDLFSGVLNQKNDVKTVTFKDKIKPKTCSIWFIYASSLTSITGLDKLDTSAVTSMRSMFAYSSSLTSLDVSSFNTAAVTDMGYMFQGCSSLTSLDVSNFNTENVTDMTYMFQGCSSLTSLDLSSFNTGNVTNMNDMFQSCSSLKTIYASSLFTTGAVSSSYSMFYGCTSLVGGAGTKFSTKHIDKTYARIDGGTGNRGYFTAKQAYAVYDSTDQSMTFFRDDKGKYTDGQVSGTKTYYTGFEDITGTATPSWCFSSGYQKYEIKTVVFNDKIQPKTCYSWFKSADSLTSITGLDKLDTSAVTDMQSMFNNCSSLTSLDLSSFNTANVTGMSDMFYHCDSLTSLDLSSFNTENVKTMYEMFMYCRKLTSLDLSSFNTAAVTDMGSMFAYCSSLKTIYASSLFTTNAVSSSSSMFSFCNSLVGGAGTKYDRNHKDKTYARIDGGTSNPGYFTTK